MPSAEPGDVSAAELLEALRAVREAIGIPNGATVGDQEARDKILVERAGHAVVMLDSILADKGWSDPAWDVQYLRDILAQFPVEGRYKTWDERMAELEAARRAGPQGGAR